jgi:hypothetical protein
MSFSSLCTVPTYVDMGSNTAVIPDDELGRCLGENEYTRGGRALLYLHTRADDGCAGTRIWRSG